MAVPGSGGADPGRFQSWPLSCALAHAIQGRLEEANDLLLEAMHVFWDAYADEMKKAKKCDKFIKDLYRESLGFAGIMLFSITYLMGIFVEELPLEGVSDENKSRVVESIGVVGLKLAEVGFTNVMFTSSFEDIRAFYTTTLSSEIENLSRHCTNPSKVPALNLSNRRLSDASLYEAMAKRLSLNPSSRRTSVYDPESHAFLAAELVALVGDNDE